jgi:hypothetical protein
MQSACAVVYQQPVRLYHIFPHSVKNGALFEKKIIEHEVCVLMFSTAFVCDIYHCKKKPEKFCHKST